MPSNFKVNLVPTFLRLKFTLNIDFVEYSTRLVSFKHGRVLNRDSELYLIEYSTKAISFEYG